MTKDSRDATVAQALAWATVIGDERAAALAKVAPSTIRGWRTKHGDRPSIRAAVDTELMELARSWRPVLGRLAREVAAELADRVAGRSTRTEPSSRDLIGLLRSLGESLGFADALLGRFGEERRDDDHRGPVQ